MDLTTVIDCTGANLASVSPPAGAVMAGYATGSAGVPWTEAQFTAHPGTVRFDQAPADTPANETMDVIDVEVGAATIADVPAWIRGARQSYHDGRRPGQRWPAIYAYKSNITPVANALTAAGLTSNVPLWLSEPMTEQSAAAMLNNTSGPFPFIGIQYQFHALFDVSLVSTAWLNTVSKAPDTSQSPATYQHGFAFCSKCQGIFYGPGQPHSACPRGGQHDGSHSHDYIIGFNK